MSDQNPAGSQYSSYAGAEVQFAAFMTGVALFFISLLLTGDPSRETALQVPLAYLFVSAFAFFYSALIYANCSSESAAVIRNDKDFQFNWANALSESLGVYCMGFAFPLTIVSYSQNVSLSLVVLGVHVLGFAFYHKLGFSIVERNIARPMFQILSSAILISYIISFFLYMYEIMTPFYIITAALGVLLFVTFVLTGVDKLSPDVLV
jgi:hypothetical protein